MRASLAKWIGAVVAAAAWVFPAAAQEPRLTGIEVQASPASVTVSGTGAAGTAYQLAWTPTLGSIAGWKHAGDAMAADDGTFSMRATLFQPPGFYRVEAQTYEYGIYSITQFGNVVLHVYGNAFAGLGFEYGDVVRASFGGREFQMPVVSSYSDVENGEMLCRIVLNEDESQSAVVLAIRNGDFAQTTGLAEKETTGEEPGYAWRFDPETVITVTMAEKGGYWDQYVLRELGGTTNRGDYAELTDEQYANFRMVAAPGIAAGRLYRSSSPVNPDLNRNREADAALDGAGVHAVLNLADTEDGMKAYPNFAETHYAGRNILALAMSMDYMSRDFRDKLAAALRFIAASDGPWLVHCSHGKDRTGFLCAILECLAGADAEAVVSDYMESYVNLYHLAPGEEKYELLAESGIVQELQDAFAVPDWRADGVDLAEEARKYLLKIGLEEEEIAAVLEKLAQRG